MSSLVCHGEMPLGVAGGIFMGLYKAQREVCDDSQFGQRRGSRVKDP